MKYKGNKEEAMYLATSVMVAGGDNTRMTLNTLVMAMISCPHVLARARAEIDAICMAGAKLRLPRMDDFNHLSYMCAMIEEVLRWRRTVPIVPPHQLTQDLSHNGYFFPKCTNFFINSIAVSQEFNK
jgi:cytochrome P450